jgi:hypothetical protein
VRCGPKVFAEKARYFHAKVEGNVDSVHCSADPFSSQPLLHANIKSEEPMPYGSQDLEDGSFSAPRYSNGLHPLNMNFDGFDVSSIHDGTPAGQHSPFTLER